MESENLALIEETLAEPHSLPPETRSAIESLAGHVDAYALADLEPTSGGRLALTRRWVALATEGLVIETSQGLRLIRLAEIRDARETSSLGLSTLTVEGTRGSLARIRHSHRQKGAFAALQFLLASRIQGESPSAPESDEIYREALLKPVLEAQATAARTHAAVVWRLLKYLKPYRGRVAFGMGCAALMALLSLAPPTLVGKLLDEVLSGHGERDRALGMISLLAVAKLAHEAFAWARLKTMNVLGERVAHDLRNAIFTHLQKLGLTFYSAKQTGSIITRVTSDTDRIWDFIAFGVVEVTLSCLMLASLSAALISLDWRLGLSVTLPIPVLVGAIALHGRKMEKLFLGAWRRWSAVTEVLSDTVPGVRVVKSFHQERREEKRFQERNRAALDQFNRIHAAWAGFWPLLMLGIHAIIVLVWALAVPRLYGEGAPLTPGAFVSFLSYLGMLVPPIEQIGQMSRMVNRATSSAYRIFEILDTRVSRTEPDASIGPEASGPEAPVALGEVRFERVSFAYDGVRRVLRDVAFTVRPGELIGLVGPSGGGKSTLTSLIARFHDPSEGRILLDGRDLRELDPGWLRRSIGFVHQESFLFHGSILDNIRYGKPEAPLAHVLEAARAANAHEFILKLASGYETVVGERGHTLSGGERQRVAIARAILHDPQVLVLDEATSAVDTETERKIQEALDRLVEGRTVFAIAHRLSTLEKADRILVIEDGRIVEQGPRDALARIEGGRYRRLLGLQKEAL